MTALSRIALAAILVAWASAALATDHSGITVEDRRQAACYDDVQRLCPNTIPDADKATACMKDKRALVSKKCAALWDLSK